MSLFFKFSFAKIIFLFECLCKKINLSKSSNKILRINRGFDYTIKPFELTEELESLHTIYRGQLTFNTSETLRVLLEDVNNEIFDTYLIEVRDGVKLIAAGIFDVGA